MVFFFKKRVDKDKWKYVPSGLNSWKSKDAKVKVKLHVVKLETVLIDLKDNR